MGSNYGKPQAIYFSNALFEVTTPLDIYNKAMKLKTQYTISKFKPWRGKLLAMVRKKLAELKQNVKPKQTRLVLSDLGVKKNFKELQQKTVFVTIDKATKNLHLFVENSYIIAISGRFPK